MKYLVSNLIHGWRKPSKKESDAIQILDENLKAEQIYKGFNIGLSLFVGYILIKFLKILSDEIVLTDIIVLATMLIVVLFVVVSSLRQLNKLRKIRKALKNNDYLVENCVIDRVEHEFSTKDHRLKIDRLAYIHNEHNEYCTKPVEITEEVEYSSKKTLSPKFIIINISNIIYKIIEVE